jgi:hypothetical protein
MKKALKNTNAFSGIPAAALLAGLFLAGAEVRALDDRDLLLYLPFDGSFAPVIARGNAEPAFGAKQPAFDTGVIGQALVAGDPDVGLSYAVKENIGDRGGTLSVWVKPLNWSPGDAHALRTVGSSLRSACRKGSRPSFPFRALPQRPS